ncbi:MAG TPA: type IIL restriction-modification enzyme MmeI, partial [Thermoanaerobaculia bacterium]|nr:type IIL restriction-modification enzyme MmeI [Thermoanaerobaculia bacterium]
MSRANSYVYDTLRHLFLDPYSLDPTKRAARVTRDVAAQVADVARQLEAAGHDPERVAKVLMRCLFTMFAEDVRLLRERIFSNAFDRWLENPEVFPAEVEDLWTKMDRGGTLWGGGRIWRFNGGLFADPVGLPLDRQQLQTLKRAAESDWADVEPAIFGTLLERALDPHERHRLGAHYTPRAYVERLVRPTIEEPLRNEWETVRATVRLRLAAPDADSNKKTMSEARAEVARFLERLTQVRILDP